MTVNFRYRLEVEGQEPYWMWQRDAAVAKADIESYDHERQGILNTRRVRNAKVVDEDTEETIAQFGPPTEEEIREITWNLCKEYDRQNTKRRYKVFLTNLVSTELEKRFGEKTENFYRNEWLEEVGLFCEKYGYAA